MYFQFLPQRGEVIFIITPTFLFDFKKQNSNNLPLLNIYEHITILTNGEKKRKCVCVCACVCLYKILKDV